MDYKKIVLGVVIIVILIFLYNWIFKDSGKKNTFQIKGCLPRSVIVSNDRIIPSSIFTYSFWVYVKEYTYKFEHEKHIFSITNGTDKEPMEVYLDKNINDLMIKIPVGDGESTEDIKVQKFPIQKWTHVLFSYRNRAMDVYIDGKIVKSSVFAKTYYKQKQADSTFTINPLPTTTTTTPDTNTDKPGYSGFLATMQYFTRAVQPEEAYAIYKAGYSGGNWLGDLFDKYRLKIAFMEDSRELNSFVI